MSFCSLRPEGGYLQRIEFILFLIQYDCEWDGLLLENIFNDSIITLLPLFLIIPLIIQRRRVNAVINNFFRSQAAKEASQAWIEEFDRDGDETLSKKEYQVYSVR